MVTNDFAQYKDAFLYSLALLWNVEVAELNLSDKGAEAAFQLQPDLVKTHPRRTEWKRRMTRV